MNNVTCVVGPNGAGKTRYLRELRKTTPNTLYLNAHVSAGASIRDACDNGVSTVLIDDAEGNMDANAQSLFYAQLVTDHPGIRFVLATKSPFILQHMRLDQVICFDKSGARIQPRTDPRLMSLSDLMYLLGLESEHEPPRPIAYVANRHFFLSRCDDRSDMEDAELAELKQELIEAGLESETT